MGCQGREERMIEEEKKRLGRRQGHRSRLWECIRLDISWLFSLLDVKLYSCNPKKERDVLCLSGNSGSPS